MMGVMWMAIILMAAIVEGDPKPILVNYFGIPASQYPSEFYRYDPKAYGGFAEAGPQKGGYPLLSQGGRYFIASPPHQGGYVTPEYAVEEPQRRNVAGHYGDDHQGGGGGGVVVQGGYYADPPSPPTVTVRPIQQYNNRDYPSSGPVTYQQREYNPVVVPHYDASYNGIVRRAGIGQDGRDHHGEAGTYAIRGGVFPTAEFEPAEYGEGGDFNARYREYEPNNYYGNDNTRTLGYSSQIHNRGDSQNPSFDKEAYSRNYDLRRDGYGVQQSERDYYGNQQLHKKVPVRGINSRAPQVFYPSQRRDEINGEVGHRKTSAAVKGYGNTYDA